MNEEERKGSSQDHRSEPSEWPARFQVQAVTLPLRPVSGEEWET